MRKYSGQAASGLRYHPEMCARDMATWLAYPRRYFPGRFHDPVNFMLVIRRKSFAVKKVSP
jgi:hypothetical protein